MNGSIFQLAIFAGIFLPAAEVGVFAYLWRSSIGKLWWFVALGLAASYFLMAVCVNAAFANIGITGVTGASADTPQAFFDPLTIRYLWLMLTSFAGSVVLLFGLRLLLAKG